MHPIGPPRRSPTWRAWSAIWGVASSCRNVPLTGRFGLDIIRQWERVALVARDPGCVKTCTEQKPVESFSIGVIRSPPPTARCGMIEKDEKRWIRRVLDDPVTSERPLIVRRVSREEAKTVSVEIRILRRRSMLEFSHGQDPNRTQYWNATPINSLWQKCTVDARGPPLWSLAAMIQRPFSTVPPRKAGGRGRNDLASQLSPV